MKAKKPLIVRIFIWICVVAMVVSLIGVYVVYMFTPTENTTENIDNNEQQEEVISTDTENGDESIELEINDENIEINGNEEFNLVTEDGEVEEMDETIEVQLENGETELVRLGDLGDSIEIN